MLRLHACACTCVQINSLRRLLRLKCSSKDSCLKSQLISIIFVWLSCLCHITSRLAPVCFSILFPNILSHTFASVCTTYLPGTFSFKEKWCFYFYFHLPFLQSSLFFETPAQRNPYHFFFLSNKPAKNQSPSTPTTTTQSIRQQASLTDSCLISHKLVLPLTHFLFCFLLLLIPFSTCPLPPSTSPWSSHFIFLPTNATQQSLKKCHFCLLLLFCNFFMSLLFSGEFIYRWLFFCPQLSDLSVSVFLSMSVSPSLSLTLCCSISFLLLLSFSFLHTIEKCHINVDGKWCIFDALLY